MKGFSRYAVNDYSDDVDDYYATKELTMDEKVKNLMKYVRDRKIKGYLDSETESLIISYILSIYLESKLKNKFDSFLSRLTDLSSSTYLGR